MLLHVQQFVKNIEFAGFQKAKSAGLLKGKLPGRYLQKGDDELGFERVLQAG